MKKADKVSVLIGGTDTAVVPSMVAEYGNRGVLCPMCGGYTTMDGRHQIRYGTTDSYVSLLCRHCERPVYGYIPGLSAIRSASTIEF